MKALAVALLLAAPLATLPRAEAACGDACRPPGAACEFDPQPCATEGQLGCPPGSSGPPCEPRGICRERYADVQADCPPPTCPATVRAATCVPYAEPLPPCPDGEWRSTLGSFRCDPLAPPPPDCDAACLNETPVRRAAPAAEAWTQDLCATRDNRVVLAWASTAQSDEGAAARGGRFQIGVQVDDGQPLPLADLPPTANSYADQPGDYQLNHAYAYTVTYREGAEDSPSATATVRFLGCTNARLQQAGSPAAACPTRIDVTFAYAWQRPESHGLLHLHFQRSESSGQTRTFDLSPADPGLLRADAGGTLPDYAVTPQNSYSYTLVTDYGHRGTVFSPFSLSAVAGAGCPAPTVTSLESTSGPSFDVHWSWLPYESGMDWFVQDLRLRQSYPDLGQDALDVARLLPPRPSDQATVRTGTVLGNVTYQFTIVVDTLQGRLTSNALDGIVAGPPGPAPRVEVLVAPTAIRPPLYYPADLQADPTAYGSANVSWSKPNDGGRPLTGFQLRFLVDDGTSYLCALGPSTQSFVFPDQLPLCGTSRPPWSRGLLSFSLRGINTLGPGWPVGATGIPPWSTDSHSATGSSGNDSYVQRTDLVREHNVTIETRAPARVPGPGTFQDNATDLKPAEPPRRQSMPGRPCSMPGLLELTGGRIDDEAAIGIPTGLLPHWQPELQGRVAVHARDQSFDSLPGDAPRRGLDIDLSRRLPPATALPLAADWHHTPSVEPLGGNWAYANWTQIFPILPDGGLPFNAAGPFCWIDEPMLTAVELPSPYPNAATRPALPPATFAFHHDVRQDAGIRADTYDWGSTTGPGCLCFWRRQTHAVEDHLLQQQVTAPSALQANVTSRGSEAPLASSAALLPLEPEEAQLMAALSRLEAARDTRLPPEDVPALRELNLEAALSQRWDVADAAPPAALPSNLTNTPWLHDAWLTVLPDLGVRDGRDRWIVPADFQPVALAGGVSIPPRPLVAAEGLQWSFHYNWTRIDQPGAHQEAADPAANRGPLSLAQFAAQAGEETWRVELDARLENATGAMRDRVRLSAVGSFLIDPLTLPGQETARLGFPVAKKDVGVEDGPLLRAWWEPTAEAPWDGSGGHPTGRRLAPDHTTAATPVEPDGLPVQSPESPRGLADDEIPSFRANDTVLAFYVQARNATSAAWRLVDGSSLEAQRDPFAAQRNYTARAGDELTFKLLVHPLLGAPPSTTVNVLPVYEHGDTPVGKDHPDATGDWKAIRIPLTPGQKLAALVVQVALPEANASAAFYIDDIAIAHKKGRLPVFAYDSFLPVSLDPLPADLQVSYAEEVRPSLMGQADDDRLTDPSYPFVRMQRTPLLQTGDSPLAAPMGVAGLEVLLPPTPVAPGQEFPARHWTPDPAHYEAQGKWTTSLRWTPTADGRRADQNTPGYAYFDLLAGEPRSGSLERRDLAVAPPDQVGRGFAGRPVAQTTVGRDPLAGLQAAPFTLLSEPKPVSLTRDRAAILDLAALNLTTLDEIEKVATDERTKTNATWILIDPLPTSVTACIEDGAASSPFTRASPHGAQIHLRLIARHSDSGEPCAPDPPRMREHTGAAPLTPSAHFRLWWTPETGYQQVSSQDLIVGEDDTADVNLSADQLRGLHVYYDSADYWTASAHYTAPAPTPVGEEPEHSPWRFAATLLAVALFAGAITRYVRRFRA